MKLESDDLGEVRNYGELRSALAFHADDDFREFAKKGIITERPIIGVKIPLVREIVSRIPASCYEEFLRVSPVAFEEVLARGMIIGRLSYGEMLEKFDSQVEYIDDWASCDTFCSGLRRLVRGRLAEFFDLKIDGLLDDPREFAVRVGLVMLNVAYMEPDWLAVIFDRVEKLRDREEYYVRMAIAWLIAECFIRFPEAGLGYMRASQLPAWTYNKAISKICDSLRADEETKEIVKGMRK